MASETYFGDEIVGRGDKVSLHVFNISVASHAHGSWATSESESMRACLEEGAFLFPELVEGGGSVLTLPACEVFPPHNVEFAQSDWVREFVSPGAVHNWQELSYEGKRRPCPKTYVPKSAVVRVFRGIASDTRGLASIWGKTDNSIDRFFDDELTALEMGRNEAADTPTIVQCPFCSKSMREIESPLVDVNRGVWKSPAIFRFDACSAGHIYGVSLQLTYDWPENFGEMMMEDLWAFRQEQQGRHYESEDSDGNIYTPDDESD